MDQDYETQPNGQMPYERAEETKRRPEIGHELEMLQKSLSDLRETVGSFVAQLDPVLAAVDAPGLSEKGAADPRNEAITHIGSKVRAARDETIRIKAEVASAMGRLEI